MKTSLLPFAASLLAASLAPAQGLAGFKFEVETLGGRKLTQDDFKNNVLLLDFWGTWCGPCRKAVPSLVKLYGKYKHHGLEIVGLNYRERGSKAEVMATIRDFARTHKITYPLAVGTKQIRNQVVGFSGYPTMLFFKKGMEFDHLETGFSEDKVSGMEAWIRKALGLDKQSAEDSQADEDKEAGPTKAEVPKGVIYQPGHNDTGFEFTVADLEGARVSFKDYRGKKVVLALTSTWDHEAVNTVAVLNEVHKEWSGKGVEVVAASLEMKSGRDDKVAAIQAFLTRHEANYKVLPVGLKFLKKVFRPEGVPLFLVFDPTGKLVLRQRSDTRDKVLKAINATLNAKG